MRLHHNVPTRLIQQQIQAATRTTLPYSPCCRYSFSVFICFSYATGSNATRHRFSHIKKEKPSE